VEKNTGELTDQKSACRSRNNSYKTRLPYQHFPRGFVLQVAVSLLQEVPAKGKELLEAKLPSYLEPVEKVD
jgi:hypothetical protein